MSSKASPPHPNNPPSSIVSKCPSSPFPTLPKSQVFLNTPTNTPTNVQRLRPKEAGSLDSRSSVGSVKTVSTMVSTKTAPTKTAPTKTAPTKTTPARKVPTKTTPSKTAPTKTVPSKKVPSKTVPSKKVQTKTISTKTPRTKSVPIKTAPTKTVPSKTVPSKTVPTKKEQVIQEELKSTTVPLSPKECVPSNKGRKSPGYQDTFKSCLSDTIAKYRHSKSKVSSSKVSQSKVSPSKESLGIPREILKQAREEPTLVVSPARERPKRPKKAHPLARLTQLTAASNDSTAHEDHHVHRGMCFMINGFRCVLLVLALIEIYFIITKILAMAKNEEHLVSEEYNNDARIFVRNQIWLCFYLFATAFLVMELVLDGLVLLSISLCIKILLFVYLCFNQHYDKHIFIEAESMVLNAVLNTLVFCYALLKCFHVNDPHVHGTEEEDGAHH